VTTIHPVCSLRGSVQLPSSKPHGQRALVLAALADGPSRLIDLHLCSETALLRDGCVILGSLIDPPDTDGAVQVRGGTRPRTSEFLLPVAGSGFALRTLLAMSCVGVGPTIFIGQRRLGQRPLSPLVEALAVLGARIEPLADDGFLPLVSWGGVLRAPAEAVSVPTGQTSQFTTALLLVAPYIRGGLRLRLQPPVHGAHYLRMTIDLMRQFGAEVGAAADLREITVRPGRYTGRLMQVGPDVTALFSFLAAAVLVDVDLHIPGVLLGVDPFVDAAIAVGRRLGIQIEPDGQGIRVVSGPPPTRPVVIDASPLPTLVPALAALACELPAGLQVRGAAHLRHHKTSRLEVVLGELAKLGRQLTPTFVDGRPDGFISRSAGEPTGVPLDSHGDHRLYVALSLAAMAGDRPVELPGEETLTASFAGFPASIAALTGPGVRI
jgi:3-phosphoshikimate 1-carboxyvinyltransferase